MLKNIKSIYFIQRIFSHVDEGRKLKLIKYNISLQKNMNISLINYKHFTGKYLIYESNGIGKEYDGFSNLLLFEGEYLNGERNGKGKEYYKMHKSIVEFEGEYKNGKRNGKGKEYDWDGKLEFEGEYLNGRRNGKGKEYLMDGQLYFEGEYLKDYKLFGIQYDTKNNILYNSNKMDRIVKEYNFHNKIIFEGEHKDGKRNGKGKEFYYDGKLKFEGKYLNGKMWEGKGYDKSNNIIYELKDGKGLIKEYFLNDKLINI